MRTFKQHLVEQTITGDCLLIAGQATIFFGLGGARESIGLSNRLHKDGATDKSIRLVHAFVSGQMHLNGYRFVHAWVEHRGKIYDFSNGKESVLQKELYYLVGEIHEKDKEQYRKYTVSQARKLATGSGHWGPWDLNMKHEKMNSDVVIPDDPINAWNEDALDEARKIFPMNMREVGRKKMRVSAEDMKAIK